MRAAISPVLPTTADRYFGQLAVPVPAARRTAVASPERALRAAVLAQALHEWRTQWAPAELVEWFASRDQTWPFAFEAICLALDLDPAAIRARLDRLPVRRPAPPAIARLVTALEQRGGTAGVLALATDTGLTPAAIQAAVSQETRIRGRAARVVRAGRNQFALGVEA